MLDPHTRKTKVVLTRIPDTMEQTLQQREQTEETLQKREQTEQTLEH